MVSGDARIYCLCFDPELEVMLQQNVPGMPLEHPNIVKQLYPETNTETPMKQLLHSTEILDKSSARVFSMISACAVDPNIKRGMRLNSLFSAALRENTSLEQTNRTVVQRMIIYIVNRLAVLLFQLENANGNVSRFTIDRFRLLPLIMNGLSKFDSEREPDLSAQTTSKNLLTFENSTYESKFIRNIIIPNKNKTGFMLLFRHPQDCYDIIHRFKTFPSTITRDSYVLYLWPTCTASLVPLVDHPAPTLKVTQLTKLHTTLLHQLDTEESIDTSKPFCQSDIGLSKTLARVMEYFMFRAKQGQKVDCLRVLGTVNDLLGNLNGDMSAQDIQTRVLHDFESKCKAVDPRVRLRQIASSQPFNSKAISSRCILDMTFELTYRYVSPPSAMTTSHHVTQAQFHPLASSYLQPAPITKRTLPAATQSVQHLAHLLHQQNNNTKQWRATQTNQFGTPSSPATPINFHV